MEIADPIKALNNAVNIIGGVVVGGFAGAQGNSFTSNLLLSSALGVCGSGLNSALGAGHKFLSRQTLAETLIFTASSVAMHLLTKYGSNRRLEPHITFADDCGCKHKKWATRVSKTSASADIGR